jgi:secondary thiamine-phosphate synthase enzyme
MWVQKRINLPPLRRGFHCVTDAVLTAVPEIERVETGILHVFLQHTSASLTINENADPDVRRDFEKFASHLVPESFPYTHTAEGPDDMPAHLKGSLFGCFLAIPVARGRLALGTWQGIYLNEHRDDGGARSLVLTLFGQLFA